jgi:hypothetical protein
MSSLRATRYLLVGMLCGCGATKPSGASPNHSSGATGNNSSGATANSGSSGATGNSSSGATGNSSSGATGNSNSGATGGEGATAGQPTPVIPLQPMVGACDNLPAPGKWEDITPAEVKAGFGKSIDYGTFAFGVDPVHLGTVYLGTLRQKMWKTTDCGRSWIHVTTGRNGSVIDPGMTWTFVIDPDTDTLYSNAGYGNGSNGGFKSTNGGVDWDPIWPPTDPAIANKVQYNFANVFAMDPSNHRHLLLSFHAICFTPFNQTCLAETMNGGATWRLMSGLPSWIGTEGQVVYFLDNSHTWLWGSSSNGFWRTADSGATWQRVTGNDAEAHLQGSQLYRAKSGAFFLAAANGVWHSVDGTVGSWSLIPNSGQLAGGLVSDGTTMFLGTLYGRDGTNFQPYYTSPEGDGMHWTPMPSPPMTEGGTLGYDGAHHILYSSNVHAGFWRVVTQ